MRRIVKLAALGVLTLALACTSGCTNTRFGFLGNEKPRAVQGPPPSKEKIVAYLNDNASRIQSFRSDSVTITIHQGLVPFGLSGKLMTEKPNKFRLSGEFATQQVVDLGSNEQEFWWWISKADPPNQYYCSYDDMCAGRLRSLPFPFQPEWIMETMGLGPYGPPEKYEMEHDDFYIRLVERTRSAQGRPVRKVIKIKREPQDMEREPQNALKPQVVEFLLLDEANGQELCSAHITQVQRVRGGTGAILPRRLELRWPEAKSRLELLFDNVALNSDLPQTAFMRRTMPGVRSVDLAQMFSGSSVQPAQGIMNP